MRKALLLAIPVVAIIAVVGFAVAQPFWQNPQNMTAGEKNVQLQILNERQSMIQDQKDYINGVITQQQYQDKLDQHQLTMVSLMQQLRDAIKADPNYQNSTISGCGGLGGHGWGKGHMGRGMMRGFW
jgi:hypothetical protein